MNSKHQQVCKQQEFDLMNQAERNFWFKDLICCYELITPLMLTPIFVKVFEKYFRLINIQEDNMRGFLKKIKILNLNGLSGLNTLWLLSTKTDNEKTLELS